MEKKDFETHYMKQLVGTKMLTKKDQRDLGYEIKKNEQLILDTCIKFGEFRNQLLSLEECIIRNPNNIVRYSKLVEEDSPESIRKEVISNFDVLFKHLKEGNAEQSLVDLGVIQLTSSTLNQLLSPIKQHFSKIVSNEEKLSKILKFLELDSVEEFHDFVEDCKNDYSRVAICKKLYINESRLYNQINDAESCLSVEDPIKVSETKSLYLKIKNLESQVEHHRHQLIRSHLPLVVSRAKRFMNQGLDFEDLVQEGNLGLIRAVDKYEPSKDIKVTTYATWWVDQAIRRAISNKSKIVRIPVHIQDVHSKVNKSYHKLCHSLMREPSTLEISIDSKIKESVILELLDTAQHEISLHSEISDGVSLSDILVDSNQQSPAATVSRNLLGNKIRNILSELSPRNEKIIRLRFGIGELEPRTLEEIGKRFGVTRERVRQLEKKSLKKLRNHSQELFDDEA